MLYGNNIDLNLNAINNPVFQVLSTSPATTKLGLFYYDSVKKSLGVYNGTTWDYYQIAAIPTNSITYNKIQQASASTLLGNPTGSAANVQEITLGTGLSFSGSVLNAAVSSVSGRTGAVVLTSSDVGLSNVANSLQVINSGGTTSIQTLLFANLPAAGTAGRIFITSDTKDIYRDNGTSFDRMSSNVSSPLTWTAGLIGIQVATTSQNGYLASTDWNTFNGKEPAITAGTTLQYWRGDKTFQTLNSAAIPDLATTVQAYRLDQFAAPTNPVSFNSQRITSVATPVASTDAANKAYVDASVQGLDIKQEVQYATTAALPANTYNNGTSGVGATLTANANAALTVDGVAVTANQRILVKNEASAANNGIYIVTQTGSAGAPYVLTRSSDMNSASNIQNGAFTFVQVGGTSNSNTGWTLSISGAVTVGTTALSFVQFSGAGTYSTGSGLTLVGTQFSAVQGLGISIGTSIAINPTVVPQKYSTSIGNASATSFAVTHNLNSTNVVVTIYDNSTFAVIYTDITITSVNAITVTFSTAPTSNQYTVVVIG